MYRYISARLLMSIPSLIGISVLVFSMMHLVPGDPLDFMFREVMLTGEQRALLREQLGLNDPLPVQYWRFFVKAIRGDLGQALFVKRPVTRIIMDELPYTVRLAVVGMTLTVIFGLSFGTLAALFHGTWLDSVIMAIAISGLSIPNFWLGLVIMLVFAVKLGWLPILGPESLKVLIMPAFVIGFRASAINSRMTRSGLLEVLNQDYIRTARAKGLPELAVIVRHGLKNALIPVVTYMGLQFGQLLGGAVVIETVFARRGVGALAVNAILQRDLPLAQGTVLFVSVIYVLVNLGVDFLYAYIDPRIHYDQ
jgi:peptide/nickel transport system permease protein